MRNQLVSAFAGKKKIAVINNVISIWFSYMARSLFAECKRKNIRWSLMSTQYSVSSSGGILKKEHRIDSSLFQLDSNSKYTYLLVTSCSRQSG